MSIKDSNFEAFASYVSESLVSLRTDMNANHAAVLAKINHLFQPKNRMLCIMKGSIMECGISWTLSITVKDKARIWVCQEDVGEDKVVLD